MGGLDNVLLAFQPQSQPNITLKMLKTERITCLGQANCNIILTGQRNKHCEQCTVQSFELSLIDYNFSLTEKR